MTSKLIKLSGLDDDKEIHKGTIFRLFNVRRLDVIKTIDDQLDENKIQLDYYDYLLVNTSALVNSTFALINISLDSNKKGEILCIQRIDEGEYFLTAKKVKEYFTGYDNVFVLH